MKIKHLCVLERSDKTLVTELQDVQDLDTCADVRPVAPQCYSIAGNTKILHFNEDSACVSQIYHRSIAYDILGHVHIGKKYCDLGPVHTTTFVLRDHVEWSLHGCMVDLLAV